MMIDTHCHLSKQFYDNVDEVIKRMKDNIIIVSATEPKEFEEVVALCEKYKNVYGTLGIHPDCCDNYTQLDLNLLENYMNHYKIVGIGEIGLDYHYTKENIIKQKELFIKQINIANKYKKSIVIHSRDSLEETYNILKKEKNEYVKGIMHCYSGDVEYAKKIISLGLLLGIGGILTFKNEQQLKEVVGKLAVDYFVLETDSPYLSPHPLRGTKNEPVNVKYVAEKIAEIKKENITKILETTTKNAVTVFDLKI